MVNLYDFEKKTFHYLINSLQWKNTYYTLSLINILLYKIFNKLNNSILSEMKWRNPWSMFWTTLPRLKNILTKATVKLHLQSVSDFYSKPLN